MGYVYFMFTYILSYSHFIKSRLYTGIATTNNGSGDNGLTVDVVTDDAGKVAAVAVFNGGSGYTPYF